MGILEPKGRATGAPPRGHVAFSRLYDALRAVDIRPELDITPAPMWRGHAAAAIIIRDPGSGRLVYSGTTMEHAARVALAFAPERAKDYGIRAALSAVRAQLELEEGGTIRDTLG